MKINKILLLLLLLSVGVISCGNNDEDIPGITKPTNLEITVGDIDTKSGTVKFEAKAENTNYFDFDFGDGKSSTPTTDNDGIISYTYSESGTYTIKVRAFATSSIFTELSKEVKVELEATSTDGYTTPLSYTGYKLVWQDEFDGTTLSSNWTAEIGTGSNGWGNNELQYYRTENTTVGDGLLTITAKKENFGGQQYTSSRLITKDKKTFEKGRIDIRAITPKGQGIWPALWMLGNNISTVSWPACGEIDIMELVGGAGKDNTVHGTLHWANANGDRALSGKEYKLSSGIFADKFHVFTIIWDDTNIKWYVDDVLFNTLDITPAHMTEFHEQFFFIFNVAVGGDWPGSPNTSTVFPQTMKVDYIRVFQPE